MWCLYEPVIDSEHPIWKIPTHTGNFVMVNGRNISLSGLILLDSCGWTIPLRRSENVVIDNVKILGYRLNSDWIDICNRRQVIVKIVLFAQMMI